MDIYEYCDFLKEVDQRVMWIDGVPFGEYRPFFYWSLPRFARYENATWGGTRRLLAGRALGVFHPDAAGGKHLVSFNVCRTVGYGLETLHPKKRNQTRRGLTQCEIRAVDWVEMAREGMAINTAALKRQGRWSSRLGNRHWWARQCAASSRCPDVLARGAAVQGGLTAYVHAVIHDGVQEGPERIRVGNISHFMSDSRHLKRYPNEALVYSVTRELLEGHGCAYVVFGAASDDRNLSAWKRHMGFIEEPVSFAIKAHPLLHLVRLFLPKVARYLNDRKQ